MRVRRYPIPSYHIVFVGCAGLRSEEDRQPMRPLKVGRQGLEFGLYCNQRFDAAVLQDVLDAPDGRLRVERNVNAPGLQDSEHADQRFNRLREVDAYSVPLPDSEILKQVRKLIRLLLKLLVG